MSYNPNNPNGQATSANSSPVVLASDQSTIPVSSASLPLPSGASTSAKQPALGTAGSASADVLSVQGVASMTPIKTDGSGVTQPISAASLPLPVGAATSANQTTGNTSLSNIDTVQGAKADTAATDSTSPWSVIAILKGLYAKLTGTLTVSGTVTTTPPTNASTNIAQVAGTATDTNSGNKSAGTQRVVIATDQPQLTNALKVDGSATTQPVSGTVTSNIGTTNGLALDATLTGGSLQAQGNVTSGSADSGNPVKVGGVYHSSAPTFTDGQRADLQLSSHGQLNVALFDSSGNSLKEVSPVDGLGAPTVTLGVASFQESWNGASWDRLRTPTIFKTATATTSGDTAVWTPTSGKKFRLMRYMIEVSNDAATSGGADIDIILRDGTTGMAASFTVYVPASGGTTMGAMSTHWVDLGNGPLSAAANNVLNVNLSAALTAGKVRVVAIGCEE